MCRFRRQLPEAASGGRFRRQVPEAGARFWRVPEGSDAGLCRFGKQVSASCGMLAEVAGAKAPDGLGRFSKVPIPEGSGESKARRRFWRVLLAYEQNNAPM